MYLVETRNLGHGKARMPSKTWTYNIISPIFFLSFGHMFHLISELHLGAQKIITSIEVFEAWDLCYNILQNLVQNYVLWPPLIINCILTDKWSSCCYSLNPARVSPMTPLMASNTTEMGERIDKVRKLMGWGKDTEKQGIHPPLVIGREVFSYLQESQSLSHIMVYWEDKCHHYKHVTSCLIFLHTHLYAEHDAVWHGIYL